METRSKQTLPIAAILSYGLPYYDEPIEVEKRPEWFKACCKYVCPNFKIDDSNRNIMNQLFLYIEGRSEKLDANKGLLLRGENLIQLIVIILFKNVQCHIHSIHCIFGHIYQFFSCCI